MIASMSTVDGFMTCASRLTRLSGERPRWLHRKRLVYHPVWGPTAVTGNGSFRKFCTDHDNSGRGCGRHLVLLHTRQSDHFGVLIGLNLDGDKIGD